MKNTVYDWNKADDNGTLGGEALCIQVIFLVSLKSVTVL